MVEEKQDPLASLVGKEISGCEILQKVAVGGMGSVYKARHKALDRIVCVKILSPSLTNDKKAVELFLTEARAIAELEHPNIVQVYNVGREKGYYFIVMGFIEGQTLSQLVKKNKNLAVDTILNLFEGVLLGLDAAHAKGIIHRDIKPSNILINKEGQPKIVDFGIAKKMDREKGSTKTTELAGTAYFIAPEQALGKDLDTRADLYSVGASLYYVLTGQFPYNGKNTIDIIQKHINEPVPNPAALRPVLPAWLCGAVQKLMAKDPENRFQTAKETYVYFQKMRAEEQLRIRKGSSINLGENSALKIVQEEKFSTTDLQKKRQEEKQLKHSTSTKPSMLPSIETAAVIPQSKGSEANNSKDIGLSQVPQNTTPIYSNPAGMSVKQQFRQTTTHVSALISNLLLKLPIFIIFTFLLAYVFYRLGSICSVGMIQGDGLLKNLVNPFLASVYAPRQWLFMGLAAGMTLLAFASAAVKEYARTTATLLFLALSAYMAGLFTPQLPFLDTENILQFLFTPQYYLCYLALALLWAFMSACIYNRSLLQGVLGASLTVLAVVLAYLSSHLSIAPALSDVFFQILFFVSLFCAIVAVYYLLNRTEKNSIALPVLFLWLACGSMWAYNVSGFVQDTNKNVNEIVQALNIKNVKQTDTSKSESDLGSPSAKRGFLGTGDKTTEISVMEDSEAFEFFNTRLQALAPEQFTDEQMRDLFSRLLTRYYKGGESNMKTSLWEYALTLPIVQFSQDAQENRAYTFLMLLLIALSICTCAGALFLGEE